MSSGPRAKIACTTSWATSCVVCQRRAESWVENGLRLLRRDADVISGGREIASVVEDASR